MLRFLWDRFLFAINFPFSCHRAANVPGTPAFYREHMDALLASNRWNSLYVQQACDPTDTSDIGAHVGVTRSFRRDVLGLFINLSKRTPAGPDAIDKLGAMVPAGWALYAKHSSKTELYFRGRHADAAELPVFIDRVFREVYGFPADYRVDVVAQAVPDRLAS